MINIITCENNAQAILAQERARRSSYSRPTMMAAAPGAPQLERALLAADSILCVRRSKSGGSLDNDLVIRMRSDCNLDVQVNAGYHHGALFSGNLLQYVSQELRKQPAFQKIYVMSMANDYFRKGSFLPPESLEVAQQAICEAGLQYRQVLEDRSHLIIFGGRGDLWDLGPEYDAACQDAVARLQHIGLNAVCGASTMDELEKHHFHNWHWTGIHKQAGLDWVVRALTSDPLVCLGRQEAGRPALPRPLAPAASLRPGAGPHRNKQRVLEYVRGTGLHLPPQYACHVRPLTREGGTAIIISGMTPQASGQLLHCCACFANLGFDPLVCTGLPDGPRLPQGHGPTSSVSWGAVALPKIVDVLTRQGAAEQDAFVVCEDSCQPTELCIPRALDEARRQRDALWCGAHRLYMRRQVTNAVVNHGHWQLLPCAPHEHGVLAPAGSKMFILTFRTLKLLEWIYCQTPTSWTVDYMFQVLVRSGIMDVMSPFFAGSFLPHYSQRLNAWSGDAEDRARVQLNGPVVKHSVVRQAQKGFRSPRGGFLAVYPGDDLTFLTIKVQEGDDEDPPGLYGFGHITAATDEYEFEAGWFPLAILRPVQYEVVASWHGAQVI